MYPAYVLKHNSHREKLVVILMIPNGEKREAKSKERWHYLAVKKRSALLRGITFKHYGGFYCLNCLHSFRRKNELELHKKLCENKDFSNVVMLSEDTKILEFNQYQKSDKATFTTYQILNV